VFGEQPRQEPRVEPGREAGNSPEAPLEGLRRKCQVQRCDLGDGHACGEAGCDDGPRGCAANQVKPVAQAEVRIAPMLSAQETFDALEKGQFNNAARAAAIERQHSFRTWTKKMPIRLSRHGGSGCLR
jgi:hypothetical protein